MRQKDSAEAAITIAAFVFEVISNSGLWQLRGPMAERVKRVVSCQFRAKLSQNDLSSVSRFVSNDIGVPGGVQVAAVGQLVPFRHWN
jgi:hypothetical protein